MKLDDKQKKLSRFKKRLEEEPSESVEGLSLETEERNKNFFYY